MLTSSDTVVIVSHSGREEGSKVTFSCREGLIPSVKMMSTCSSGRWLPLNPRQLDCQPGKISALHWSCDHEYKLNHA